jgi:urease accessory protein
MAVRMAESTTTNTEVQAAPGTSRLTRLLQLASPTLPVGAYSYSGGLEAAVEAGHVRHAGTAGQWIMDVFQLAIGRMEAPILGRMLREPDEIDRLNEHFLASRESAELRAETLQMGWSLARLAVDLGVAGPELDEPSYPAVFATVAKAWRIGAEEALIAYCFAWVENQVMAAVKAVPLGQTEAQKLLLMLGDRVPAVAAEALAMPETAWSNFTPGLAIISAKHETQYSRLFRS